MRMLVGAVLVLVATAAWAGEVFIGRLYTSDAGAVNNANTGYATAGCSRRQDPLGAGACDQAFAIAPGSLITIQPIEACLVSVNRPHTDAGIAVVLAAGEKFPTSLAPGKLTSAQMDGGVYSGGLVTIAPVAGALSCRANVFERSGTE